MPNPHRLLLAISTIALLATHATLAAEPVMLAQQNTEGQFVDIFEGGQLVLRYSHGNVPVPEGVSAAYERGDYINLLYGLDGELLTDDYPHDHPHHRGLGWSWPVTRWKDEVRDIWAVRGVWARPVKLHRIESGDDAAVIEAESVWRWGDKAPIVREFVVIRAMRQKDDTRLIDIEVRMTALADGVAIGGRPHGGYGGFGLRAAPVKQQKITEHIDPAGATPRRSWLDYSGRFQGGKGISGLTILEHPSNPDYPSEMRIYPNLNYIMPAFPGDREVPLSKTKPLVLKHRVIIHRGSADAANLPEAWKTYAAEERK